MILPHLKEFQKVDSSLGNLSIIEVQKHIDFEIKRIFFLDEINSKVVRGNHAHKNTAQFMICLKGEIDFYAEMPNGEKINILLTQSNNGIYIPANAWHYMEYKKGSIQLVCASELYEESDYLRSKEDFHSYYNNV